LKPLPAFEDLETKRLILELCHEYEIDVPLLRNLCEVMQGHSGSGRKHDVDADLAGCLDRFIARHPEL
jgi:hypothetical protein